MDFDVMYNELITASEAVAILAENALKSYPQQELAGQLAQASVELVDRISEMHEWVSTGGPLPGQVQEVRNVAMAMIHLANAVDLLNQRRTASYSHSFSPEFYGDPYNAQKSARPTNVSDAILSMSDPDWTDMAAEVFGIQPDRVDVEMVLQKIIETNTVSDLSAPVEVWIDPEGWYTVSVYDEKQPDKSEIYREPTQKSV
jgi:hypothetical protein